jgi:MFS family permease
VKKSLSVILITIFLDAVGIGLIMPILPELLRSLAGAEAGGVHYGALLAVYALMQFIFAPILGALSDRFGRRPVLIISIAGATADYLLMAAAHSLLYILVVFLRELQVPTWLLQQLMFQILLKPMSVQKVWSPWSCLWYWVYSGSGNRWSFG